MSTTYTEGNYLAEVVDQGFDESSQKRTPCFFLQIRILSRCGEDGTTRDCPQFKRTCSWWFVDEKKSFPILQSDLEAQGVEVSSLTQLHPSSPGHVSLVGRKLRVQCKLEIWESKTCERWAVQRPRKKLGGDAVRALKARFGHKPKSSIDPVVPMPEPDNGDAAAS